MLIPAVLAFALASVACSVATPPPERMSCLKTDRNGVYRMAFELVCGDCGQVPVTMEDLTAAPPEGCRVESETWADQDCYLERVIVCERPEGLSRAAYVSRQQTPGGDFIRGELHLDVHASHGGGCQATYDWTATR